MLSSGVATIVYISIICNVLAGEPPGVYDNGHWVDLRDEIADPRLRPFEPENVKPDENTIMVEIAAFRDPRCSATLEHIYTKAKHPQRVFVGVVQQNDDNDPDCLNVYCERMRKTRNLPPDAPCPYAQQIRIFRVHYSLGRGPVLARSAQILLNRNEEFCLQIDSHTDFIEHWDNEIIKQWDSADNEYAILTTYVPKVEDLTDNGRHAKNINNHWEVPHLCAAYFTGTQMVRNHQAKAARNLKKPKLTNVYAAGLAFGKCHHRKRVPVDPHLPQVFDGEEFSYGLRLFTAGYDMYTPSRNIVFHDYNSVLAGRAKQWTHDPQEEVRSRQRLHTLWKDRDSDQSAAAHQALGLYDAGKKRTVEQFFEFSGIDPRTRTTTETKEGNPKCHYLDWVPFQNYKDDSEVDYTEESRKQVVNVLSKYVRDGMHSDVDKSGALHMRGEVRSAAAGGGGGGAVSAPQPPPPSPPVGVPGSGVSSNSKTRAQIAELNRLMAARFAQMQAQIDALTKELEATNNEAKGLLSSNALPPLTNTNNNNAIERRTAPVSSLLLANRHVKFVLPNEPIILLAGGVLICLICVMCVRIGTMYTRSATSKSE